MALLLEADFPVAVVELERAIGSKLEAEDAIARMERDGVIHRIDGQFLIPSRAAMTTADLLGF